MRQTSKKPLVKQRKTTAEIENLRKLVKKMSTLDYSHVTKAAEVTRTTAWRFKTGNTTEITAANFLALQKAYVAFKVKEAVFLAKVAGAVA